jgi:hypothetical protein
MLNKIPIFDITLQKVLPTVFDDSLSYFEAIGKLMAHINEIASQFNGMIDETNLKEYSADITNKRKLSPTGDFTGTLRQRTLDSIFRILDDEPLKEYSADITNKRKLSPTGDFTGTLRQRTLDAIFADINNSLSLCNTLIDMVNHRESIGTIYDGGPFLDVEPPVITIEGGLF